MSTPGVVAIIPARGGSQRLPRKNLYPVFGRPLLRYAIEACQNAAAVNRGVYVSTEDEEIASVARALGAYVIARPPELAGHDVWTQAVVQHSVQHLEQQGIDFDTVARIYASPFVTGAMIDAALKKLDRHRLWEVFSVDQNGVEDAVIHVLRKHCVWQSALSVYKGVVRTNYRDVHTAADILTVEQSRVEALEAQSRLFLRQLEQRINHGSFYREIAYVLGQQRSLWRWQRRIPLWRRWQKITASNPELNSLLIRRNFWDEARHLRVLDLGCGFGMYWPIMREYGFRKFVGVDLFDLRAPQSYYEAAQEYIIRFCPDCETQLVMADVRDLANYPLRFDRFDVILNVATVSTKAGSTGIPRSLLHEIVGKYGTRSCVTVHLENI